MATRQAVFFDAAVNLKMVYPGKMWCWCAHLVIYWQSHSSKSSAAEVLLSNHPHHFNLLCRKTKSKFVLSFNQFDEGFAPAGRGTHSTGEAAKSRQKCSSSSVENNTMQIKFKVQAAIKSSHICDLCFIGWAIGIFWIILLSFKLSRREWS